MDVVARVVWRVILDDPVYTGDIEATRGNIRA